MTSKKNTILQFPLNKDIPKSKLSIDQVELRKTKKKYKYRKSQRCKYCDKVQPIQRFYIADRKTGRRHKKCGDCKMKDQGIVEIGKLRFAKKILDKGFRRCSVCKKIKPLTEFSKNVRGFGGWNNTCYSCSFVLHKKWFEKVKVRKEPKYFFGDEKFITKSDFSRFVSNKFGLTQSAVLKRIEKNYPIDKLGLSEFDARSQGRKLVYSKEKYFYDDQKFYTQKEFAIYLSKKYDLTVSCVLTRLYQKYPIDKLGLSEFEARSQRGKIHL